MRIIVVILLAAISIVNASPFHIYKRAVDFVPCEPASTIVLTGKVDPDPAPGAPAKATMSFTTTDDAPKLFLTTTLTGGAGAAKVTTADLCAGGALTCPVPKGQQVTITSSTDIPADNKAPQLEYNINDGATTIACGKVAGAAGAAPPAGGGGGGGGGDKKAPPPDAGPGGGGKGKDGGKGPDAGPAPGGGGGAPGGPTPPDAGPAPGGGGAPGGPTPPDAGPAPGGGGGAPGGGPPPDAGGAPGGGPPPDAGGAPGGGGGAPGGGPPKAK